MAKQAIGRFSKMGKQLQDILIKLLQDDDIIRLLVDKSDNPLSYVIPDDFDRYSLLRTQLYTQVYMPPTDSEQVVVCAFYNGGGIGGNSTYYKKNKLTIAIVIHRDLWDVEDGLRAYLLADRIDYLLNREYTTDSLSEDWYDKFRYRPVNEYYNVVEIDFLNWN